MMTMPLRMQRGAQARPFSLGQAREAQQIWARTRIKVRLALLRRMRHQIAATAEEIAQTIPCETAGGITSYGCRHLGIRGASISRGLPLSRA